MRLAQFLEGRGQPEMAADVWVNASQAERAISLYVQVRMPMMSLLALAWRPAQCTVRSARCSAHRCRRAP